MKKQIMLPVLFTAFHISCASTGTGGGAKRGRKMKRKSLFVGMLSIMLVFGMAVIGCECK
jgi:hypothetical protein